MDRRLDGFPGTDPLPEEPQDLAHNAVAPISLKQELCVSRALEYNRANSSLTSRDKSVLRRSGRALRLP